MLVVRLRYENYQGVHKFKDIDNRIPPSLPFPKGGVPSLAKSMRPFSKTRFGRRERKFSNMSLHFLKRVSKLASIIVILDPPLCHPE
jgi:hypothetical protein